MKILESVRRILSHLKHVAKVPNYPHVHTSAKVDPEVRVLGPEMFYMEEKTNINQPARIGCMRSKFVMKSNSGAAAGLYVIPGNHINVVGYRVTEITNTMKDELDPRHDSDKDVIVDEDVWIGARVSLLNGVQIGRGAIVGTGAVVRKSIPPYAVVVGNPAKIVGFRFTPEEIIEHEKKLYKEEERLPITMLEKNYEKYYLSKLKEIRAYLSLSC